MANLDEKWTFKLIKAYYNEKDSPEVILATLLKALAKPIQDVKNLSRAKLTKKELESEAILAALAVFKDCAEAGNAENFEARFLARLRVELRQHEPVKAIFEDVGEIEIEDPNPNPEEIYIQKELVELTKKALESNFKPRDVTWFMRYFAHGETFESIGEDFGLSDRAVAKVVVPMLEWVQNYMKERDAY